MPPDLIAELRVGTDPEGLFLLLPAGEGLPVRVVYQGIDWTFRGYEAGRMVYRPDYGA